MLKCASLIASAVLISGCGSTKPTPPIQTPEEVVNAAKNSNERSEKQKLVDDCFVKMFDTYGIDLTGQGVRRIPYASVDMAQQMEDDCEIAGANEASLDSNDLPDPSDDASSRVYAGE